MMSNTGKSSRWYNVKPRIVQNICTHQNLSNRIKHIPIEGFPPSTPNKPWFHPSCHWVKLYINHSLSGHFLEGSCKFTIPILGCSPGRSKATRPDTVRWYIATFERCHTRLTGSNVAFFKHFWLSTCVTNFWLDYIQNQADSRSEAAMVSRGIFPAKTSQSRRWPNALQQSFCMAPCPPRSTGFKGCSVTHVAWWNGWSVSGLLALPRKHALW